MRRGLILISVLLAATFAALADDEPFFPKPAYFKRHFGTVSDKVELQAPAHLDDFIVSDRIELSLKNYLQLVMSNNPDISIQKIVVGIQENAITRAFSIYDPIGLARFSTTRTKQASNNTVNGAAILNTLSQPFSLSYSALLPTGTTYNINFADNKFSTNSGNATFNPSYQSTLNFNISQPLLRGRGGQIVRLPILIARSNLKASRYTQEDQIIQLIATAELAYWNLVEARENLLVQEKALKLADESLKRSRRELELGAISSLEIFQPEAQFANAQIFVTQARYRLQQAEDAVRRQIGADQTSARRETPIVLTETIEMPDVSNTIDKEQAVERALARRPDLKATMEYLGADDLNIRLTHNSLLPDLSFTGQYGSFGQGGNFYPRQTVVADGTVIPVIAVPGGFNDALGQLFGFGLPTFGFGLTLRLPIRDHRAAADLADAMVNKKLDSLRLKSAQQNTRLQVLQALSQVENSKASVDLAKVARDLAQKRVDAEQKRYDLGTTTIFFVLAAQTDLTTAESSLVRELINYRRNLLNFTQRSGSLLDDRGIQIQ